MAAAAIPRPLTPTPGQAPRQAENELGHQPAPNRTPRQFPRSRQARVPMYATDILLCRIEDVATLNTFALGRI